MTLFQYIKNKVHNNMAIETLEYIFKPKAVYCGLCNHNSCGRHPVHSLLSETLESSRPEVFCKKRVLRTFVKFTGKHLRQSLFFNKVAGLSPATLFKKRLWHSCFPLNFAKFLGTRFFIEHIWWLLLI